jgi:hypothetical protein
MARDETARTVADWFTLSPKHRTKKRLIEMLRANASSEFGRMMAALERISAVQIGEEEITDPDWKARLMQRIAREALNGGRSREHRTTPNRSTNSGQKLPSGAVGP